MHSRKYPIHWNVRADEGENSTTHYFAIYNSDKRALEEIYGMIAGALAPLEVDRKIGGKVGENAHALFYLAFVAKTFNKSLDTAVLSAECSSRFVRDAGLYERGNPSLLAEYVHKIGKKELEKQSALMLGKA